MTIILVRAGIGSGRETLGLMRHMLPLVVILMLIGWNGYKVINYMFNPSYSLLFMCEEVGRIVAEDRNDGRRVSLIGHMANTVGLAAGLSTINSQYGTQPLSWKMAEYDPQYYISLGDEVGGTECGAGYELSRIKSWDILGNYDHGKKVELYRIGENRSRMKGLSVSGQGGIPSESQDE